MLARHLCEALTAAGYDVWFAEYTILLSDRDKFQTAIDLGTAQSRFAVALTNTDYTVSDHCCNELRQLLMPENCGPKRLIEVRNPGDPQLYIKFPELGAAHRLDYRNLTTTIRFIEKATELRIACGSSEQLAQWNSAEQRTTFHHADIVYSLAPHPWHTSSEKDVELGNETISPSQRFILDSCKGRIWAALYVGSKSGTPREKDRPPSDQKVYYDELLREAEREYGADSIGPRALDCLGVHLYRLCDLTHPAFTCFKQPRSWFREYSIILPDELKKRNVRFEFVFSFRGPFRDFARIGCLLDDFALSLRLEKGQP